MRSAVRAASHVVATCLLLLAVAPSAEGSDVQHRDPAPINHSCQSGPFALQLWSHCGEFPEALPISFQINTSGVPGSVAGGFSGAVTAAMRAWDLSEDQVTFTLGGTTTRTPGSKDGVSVIGFGNPATCNQPGAIAVACLWFKSAAGPGRHVIIETDIILNSSEVWRTATGAEETAGAITGNLALATASWFDLQEFLTHELGHAIGLDDLGNPNGVDPWPETISDTGRHMQTMYRYAFRGSTSKRSLELGDRLGLSFVHENM